MVIHLLCLLLHHMTAVLGSSVTPSGVLCRFWCSHAERSAEKLEMVQKRITRVLTGLENKTYSERKGEEIM